MFNNNVASTCISKAHKIKNHLVDAAVADATAAADSAAAFAAAFAATASASASAAVAAVVFTNHFADKEVLKVL